MADLASKACVEYHLNGREKKTRERGGDDGNKQKAEREADRDTSQKKVTERKRSERAFIQ